MLTAFAAGCAELQWHQPGAEAALGQDLEACRQEARLKAAREAWPFSLLTRRIVSTDHAGRVIVFPPPPPSTERFALEQDYTRQCMRGKGYELAPVEKR